MQPDIAFAAVTAKQLGDTKTPAKGLCFFCRTAPADEGFASCETCRTHNRALGHEPGAPMNATPPAPAPAPKKGSDMGQVFWTSERIRELRAHASEGAAILAGRIGTSKHAVQVKASELGISLANGNKGGRPKSKPAAGIPKQTAPGVPAADAVTYPTPKEIHEVLASEEERCTDPEHQRELNGEDADPGKGQCSTCHYEGLDDDEGTCAECYMPEFAHWTPKGEGLPQSASGTTAQSVIVSFSINKQLLLDVLKRDLELIEVYARLLEAQLEVDRAPVERTDIHVTATRIRELAKGCRR